ncbi:MAG: coenzyme F420-0:L-glutamate ligase [Actinobacteria bacterium]|nr:coenzyme F420-0:L-glutamate ligase [Actinomycetota bacterium]
MTIELIPVEGLPEVGPGDDLGAMLAEPLRALGAREGDVLVVTQKIVSKAEGRVVPGTERTAWVERETARVVARRGDLLIAETRHGFVCANAGVDASNVRGGFVSLLPEDPDASAERIRTELAGRLGLGRLGVVVTDTFGRPWRIGLVNVAIGCAGLPALVDLRATTDHFGRELEATIVALADEVAAASGLVIDKASRVPAVLVRGVETAAPHGRASDLVRPADEDLFRESPLVSISARRTIRSFGAGEVPRAVLEEAVRAACTSPAPHHTRPWLFLAIDSPPAKRRYLGAMAEAWRADLEADGADEPTIARRLERSDAVLGAAPVLIVPWIRFRGSHDYPDPERSHAEQEMFLLSGGAAIQSLLLALHAQGVASCWLSSSLFCQQEARAALRMGAEWFALGTVAAGPMPEGGAPSPRPSIDLAEHLRYG